MCINLTPGPHYYTAPPPPPFARPPLPPPTRSANRTGSQGRGEEPEIAHPAADVDSPWALQGRRHKLKNTLLPRSRLLGQQVFGRSSPSSDVATQILTLLTQNKQQNATQGHETNRKQTQHTDRQREKIEEEEEKETLLGRKRKRKRKREREGFAVAKQGVDLVHGGRDFVKTA